jgi:hypothetical protein
MQSILKRILLAIVRVVSAMMFLLIFSISLFNYLYGNDIVPYIKPTGKCGTVAGPNICVGVIIPYNILKSKFEKRCFGVGLNWPNLKVQ